MKCWLVFSISACLLSASVFAEEPAASEPAGSIGIAADELLDSPVKAPQPWLRPAAGTDPKLAPLLTRWVRASQEVRSLEARLDRIVYDHVFNIEQRWEGSYVLLPDGWRLELMPVEMPRGAVSSRVDRSGRRYTFLPAVAETWVLTSEKVVWVDPEHKVWRSLSSRGNLAGWLLFCSQWNLPPSVIPFASGACEEDVRSRFCFESVKETESEVQLTARPLTMSEASWCSRVSVILDARTLATKAVQIVRPGEHEETVYVLHDVKLNEATERKAESLVPDRTGYRVTEH
ncbi:MAG TPA: hypothetical protein VML55_10855 [Planctomycetaceae bacterium]|nr:hypothetical protein [Planctomycetaceae bacterium]